MRRSLLATLALSQGVPMLCAGDEMGRTQSGNNNAYCQDNETNWVDWRLSPDAERFLTFVRELVAFRAGHPVLRQRRFLRGCRIGEAHARDLAWFDPAGGEMTDVAWHAVAGRCVGMRLDGDATETDDVDAQGRQILDDTLLVLFNAGRNPVDFSLPAPADGGSWRLVFDTADETVVAEQTVHDGRYRVRDRTVAVLLTPREPRET